MVNECDAYTASIIWVDYSDGDAGVGWVNHHTILKDHLEALVIIDQSKDTSNSCACSNQQLWWIDDGYVNSLL